MQKGKINKRFRKLIVFCAFCAIVLTVSTYAWFFGFRTVGVSSFDVEIATSESLMLSLNGSDWANTVSITKETFNTASYTGNTNSWGGAGLIPMSTIGEMDSASSTMKLYEKSSLTPVTGGYRLLSSRVLNSNGSAIQEQPGYVAFDLFVRNFTGAEYYTNMDVANEEAIYLTTASSVTVAADGVANTGIENSVRVAFTQIGRIKGTTTTANLITGLTCAGGTTGSTGICRDAQIWEPNDTAHVDAAISYYDTSCIKRLYDADDDTVGKDVTSINSYDFTGGTGQNEAVHCKTVSDGTAYDTYAIADKIIPTDNVNVYDGDDYNGYPLAKKAVTTEGETVYEPLMEAYPYFTDTMKTKTGTARPQFMTLAPNSITKLRVYIYLEGQDIDNYDFASIGRKISIQFGFTKERFIENDINYEGPDLFVGTCVGGTGNTSGACATARGKWDAFANSCSEVTQSYCSTADGTFTARELDEGTCTDTYGNTPTTQIGCTSVRGIWNPADGETPAYCSGTTRQYCDSIDGAFVMNGYEEGTCTEGTVPATESDCILKYGTWNGTTCSGTQKRYCDAIGGTFSQ